jgi:hypothetical protein
MLSNIVKSLLHYSIYGNLLNRRQFFSQPALKAADNTGVLAKIIDILAQGFHQSQLGQGRRIQISDYPPNLLNALPDNPCGILYFIASLI